jgi:AcrR family transcriptional regulator
MARTAPGSSASATGPPAASTACPSGTANAACVLSQASICGSALALIPAGRNARTIRSSLAGANLAAVGYHFGSKAELLAAVIRRVTEHIIAAQGAGLDRLLTRTPDPTVTELVAAFAGPLFDEMPADAEGGAWTSQLIVTIIADPAEEVRSWTGPAEDTVRDRYLAAFGRALPGLSPQELWFRMRGILAVVAVDRVEVYNQPTPGCMTPVAGEAARRWAITFLAAAMSAPPTGT